MNIDLDAERLPPCPHCGGPHSLSPGWIDSLTWRHLRECPLYERDSATADADHQRRRGVRPMTDTERELARNQFEDPPPDHTFGVKFRHGGVHRRRVVIVAPNSHTTYPATRKAAA